MNLPWKHNGNLGEDMGFFHKVGNEGLSQVYLDVRDIVLQPYSQAQGFQLGWASVCMLTGEFSPSIPPIPGRFAKFQIHSEVERIL